MKKKSSLFVYIYYILLLTIFFSRPGEVEPSMMMRLLFVGAVIVPTFFVKEVNFAGVITFFYSMTIYGISYSYMPYTLSQYAYITIIVTIILLGWKNQTKKKTPPILIIITAYVFFVNALNTFDSPNAHVIENIFWGLLMLCCIFQITDNKDKQSLSQLSICFELAAILLSLLFFINREQYAVSYGKDGLERSSWVDPNYFGMVIGMGVLCGGLNLFGFKKRTHSLSEIIIDISTIIVSFPVLVLNASRGAILAVAVGLSILLIFSKTKTIYKSFVISLGIVGLFYLYNNHYFDLLEYRIIEDESGGSGRIGIWESKLNAFSQEGIFQYFLGNGYYKGMSITGRFQGFHNEYVGFLVEYGVIGELLLLYMLYYPIKKAKKSIKDKNERIKVYVVILYLSTCFMTLEPFGLGIFTFFTFYFYGLMLAMNERILSN